MGVKEFEQVGAQVRGCDPFESVHLKTRYLSHIFNIASHRLIFVAIESYLHRTCRLRKVTRLRTVFRSTFRRIIEAERERASPPPPRVVRFVPLVHLVPFSYLSLAPPAASGALGPASPFLPFTGLARYVHNARVSCIHTFEVSFVLSVYLLPNKHIFLRPPQSGSRLKSDGVS